MMQMWRSVVACTLDSGRKRLTQILWQGRNTDKRKTETQRKKKGEIKMCKLREQKKVEESFVATNFFAYTVPRIRNRNYGLVGSIFGVYYLCPVHGI